MSVRQHLIERAARQFSDPSLLTSASDPHPGLQETVSHPAPEALAPPSESFARDAGEPSSLLETVLPETIPLKTGMPISIEMMKRAGLAVFGSDRSRVMEEWRVIASTLVRQQRRRMTGNAGNGAGAGMVNTLMVTSSRAKEGKSFCSLNLAATIANNRRAPTVLVDLDAKPNALSKLLGLADAPGLLDLVANPSLPMANLLVATAVPNLHVLPIGSRTASGTRGNEAGVTHAVIDALERVARHFGDRLLVLDTAPCLATSDAVTLAPLVGQIAMIIEAETTQKNDIETALGLLAPCGAITLVLNKARTYASGHFGIEYYGFDGPGR